MDKVYIIFWTQGGNTGVMASAIGDVREKLDIARRIARDNPEFESNVRELEKVIPEDIKASEINVRLGATWIPEIVPDWPHRPAYIVVSHMIPQSPAAPRHPALSALAAVQPGSSMFPIRR